MPGACAVAEHFKALLRQHTPAECVLYQCRSLLALGPVAPTLSSPILYLIFSSLFPREENALVDQFVFEVLVVFLESLALTHGDEKSLGVYLTNASFECLSESDKAYALCFRIKWNVDLNIFGIPC